MQFSIFHDPEYQNNKVNVIGTLYFQLLNKTANSFHDHCYFDNNSVHSIEGFYLATAENNKVCFECVQEKDPQLINILNFIVAGKDYDAKINKLNMGLDELRKMIAKSDPNAKKCPVCRQNRAYKKSFDGHYGFFCNNCQIGYIGSGCFYYNGKNYTLEQSKKIYKMKAFK